MSNGPTRKLTHHYSLNIHPANKADLIRGGIAQQDKLADRKGEAAKSHFPIKRFPRKGNANNSTSAFFGACAYSPKRKFLLDSEAGHAFSERGAGDAEEAGGMELIASGFD